MPTLDKLVSVSINLATTAFQPSSYSTLAMVYNATNANDVAPQLVSSAAEAIAVTSLVTAAYEYQALQVIFSQTPCPLEVMLIPIPQGSTDAVAALNLAMPQALALGGFYGLLVNGTTQSKQAVADWAEANQKLYVTTDGSGTAGTSGTTDLCSYAQTKNYNYSAVFGTPQGWPIYYPDAASLAQGFGYAPGTENWANMQLTGVSTCALTDTERGYILGKNGNTFEPYGNPGGNVLSLTFKGTVGSGQYIDVIRGRDWLCNQIKTAVANVLINRPKLPFTDGGISVVKNAILSVLETAMRNGFLDAPTLAPDGTVTPSYTVTVPSRAQQGLVNLAARNLAGITFTARLAGAIDTVTGSNNAGIQGTLVYVTE